MPIAKPELPLAIVGISFEIPNRDGGEYPELHEATMPCIPIRGLMVRISERVAGELPRYGVIRAAIFQQQPGYRADYELRLTAQRVSFLREAETSGSTISCLVRLTRIRGQVEVFTDTLDLRFSSLVICGASDVRGGDAVPFAKEAASQIVETVHEHLLMKVK